MSQKLCIQPVGHVIQKPWGTTETKYLDSGIAVVEIVVKAGGFSSIHCHQGMANTFIVTSGYLRITEIFQSGIDGKDEEEVTFCDCGIDSAVCVPAGVRHKFDALSDSRAIEIYHPLPGKAIDPEDIKRFSENGIKRMRAGGI